ncbi:unnamed protein product [Candidula unifasciata]|uniref:Uncharacterized protein n=1 Tax=Candidula unifasciata TaxID=100452 RepID=A0A8S3YV67_9EUPU|nr:unnamed protein product [Candidula unifasciata]
METQRLITVSLGKIAQSRGQRGGINLHKNLLVATVLHKARTAYMMESYSYQQSYQRQQQIRHQPELKSDLPSSGDANKAEACPTWCDSNLGQADATPTAAEQTVPEITACQPDTTPCLQLQIMDSEIVQDKENSPPEDSHLNCSEYISSMKSAEQVYHLSAANQLSQESQPSSNSKSTCKVLKRRRTNKPSSSGCPSGKKARVSSDLSSQVVPSDYSDFSEESDIEADMQESSQISNLVSIFNSGFSGLCAITSETGLNTSNYQSDSDISSSQLSLNKLRPEKPVSAFSRMVADSSMSCSSQVNRLDSLPSAIVLSA